MTPRHLCILAIPAALAACVPMGAAGDDGRAGVVPAATALGPAQRCLNASTITRSFVRDDRTIDFMVGSRTWRNALPGGCSQLGYERAISYDVRGNSLCAGETVYVLQTYGGQATRGPACILGEFVPVELERR